MSELLTTKQLQDLLKIDRITVYRMLNAGRLKGVKIGNHWRFPQSEIDRLMGVESKPTEPEGGDDVLKEFPSDCVGKVQEIFAGIIGIGAVVVSTGGVPLTEPTYANPFCKAMLASASGRAACQASWRKIAMRTTGSLPVQTCHAGLCYQRSQIDLENQQVAWLVAGQFYIQPPDAEQETERLENLAHKHQIPLSELTRAAARIPVLKRNQLDQVQEWTPRVAATINSILCERSDLMSRLRRIADLTQIHPTLSK
ncbi:MAG TPA: PocR ligand-binding domain-containing protein [Anaerolinea sp.]|nr:PocR ligand-binding domain-containing protein [Anaerolinea sp.]